MNLAPSDERQRGFTLVELLVALGIFLVITGAAFSLLPPENATGNYVKVVQRVPVKIVLDEEQQVQHVLGPGMSVVPTVAVDHGTEAAFVIAIIAVVLAAGVIVGAALWIGTVRGKA